MKLLEYKGKELLEGYGIPIQNGIVVDSAGSAATATRNLKPPYVIKAQVMAGGRGKAGGIKFAQNSKEVRKVSSEILGMAIKNILVKKVLIAQKVEIDDEWYLSIMLDRLSKSPMIIFSPIGGVDIEETAKTNPEKIVKISVDPVLGIMDFIARYIFRRFKLGNVYFDQFRSLLKNLYKLFIEYDCTLVEINPLAVTKEEKLIALDCKTDIDDSSLSRHPDIVEFRENIDENRLIKEARKFNFLYIPVDRMGDIAVMSNGSGMLMSCIDLITKTGAKVRAAFDLGGGATSDRISEAVKIIFKDEKTKYLFISIFGGITRCDEVAKGLMLATESGTEDKTIIIRLEGTNKEKALKILKDMGERVISAGSISEGVEKLISIKGSK